MKKLLSLMLCFLTIVTVLVMPAAAVKLSAGTEALRAEFESGEAELDYVYYSPVKNRKDDTKYPLVLWLHGNSSGNYPGHQLENSDIHKFASEDFQSRFKDAGGAFLLLPRDDTTDISLAWDMELEAAMQTLISFVEEYEDNIDINRIYVGGNSMGGKGVFKIAANYPDVFAAIFPISPVYVPTVADINALKDTSIWIFSNTKDRYPQLTPLSVATYFSQISSASTHPENCRWTAFELFYYSDGNTAPEEVHNTWTPVLNDLFMDSKEEYYGMTTVDGNGKTVHLTYPNGFISWLSSQSLEESSLAISSNINFFKKIIQFFVSVVNAIVSIFGL